MMRHRRTADGKRTVWGCFFLLVIPALLFFPSFCGAIDTTARERSRLTPQEQTYVRDHKKVTLCVDPDWVPFERLDATGRHVGIAANLLELVSARTGVEFELVPTKNWNESLAFSKSGRSTVLSFLNQTVDRSEWLIFTAPLFSDPNVFITREEHPFIADPASLENESIVFPEGTAMEELVRGRYPNLLVKHAASEEKAMDMVSSRRASMTLRSLIVAAYTIRKQGLFNLKIAGQLPMYRNHLRIGVRKNEVVLRNILNKGVLSIMPLERGRAVNEHVSINVQTAVDPGCCMAAARSWHSSPCCGGTGPTACDGSMRLCGAFQARTCSPALPTACASSAIWKVPWRGQEGLKPRFRWCCSMWITSKISTTRMGTLWVIWCSRTLPPSPARRCAWATA